MLGGVGRRNHGKGDCALFERPDFDFFETDGLEMMPVRKLWRVFMCSSCQNTNGFVESASPRWSASDAGIDVDK